MKDKSIKIALKRIGKCILGIVFCYYFFTYVINSMTLFLIGIAFFTLKALFIALDSAIYNLIKNIRGEE